MPSSVPAQSTPPVTGDSAIAVRLWPLLVTPWPGGVRRRGRAAPAAVVLEAAVDAVRGPHVHRDAVELADREPPAGGERLAPVLRHVQPAVVPEDQVVRVLRVDPQGVVVAVHAS